MNQYRQAIEHAIVPEAITFFAVFSRFEFALKRGGFLLGNVGHPAGPDWARFSAALGQNFFDAMKAAPEAHILFDDPPKKLMVFAADDVRFVKPAKIVSLQLLFEAVRLVRNNLFHGEKVLISQRDRDLMKASLFVLDAAMEACQHKADCARVPYAFMFAQTG
ncbi:hypothetical protein [Neoaquamicrobium sediminum]|uniref:hypothetical protein n=1 Tax=Neoaquamicrobium sediminum TaxID=1849104 RepID=UPI003BABA70E